MNYKFHRAASNKKMDIGMNWSKQHAIGEDFRLLFSFKLSKLKSRLDLRMEEGWRWRTVWVCKHGAERTSFLAHKATKRAAGQVWGRHTTRGTYVRMLHSLSLKWEVSPSAWETVMVSIILWTWRVQWMLYLQMGTEVGTKQRSKHLLCTACMEPGALVGRWEVWTPIGWASPRLTF
jgi:hypothetical protein